MGVPRKMPLITRGPFGMPSALGIHKYRMMESPAMTAELKAPFPYPGGKSDAAPLVWARFGVVDNYVEPFCGSSAMLLARPGGALSTETVNDIDGLLINAYRCICFAPDETAELCDWPVSECDLTSRHLALKAARDELTARLFGDPLYCDPTLGAWWLWGIASWIGDGWCVADGPWISVDGRLVDRRQLSAISGQPEGVKRQMPEVGMKVSTQGSNAPKGILKYTYRAGVPRQMPMIGGRSGHGTLEYQLQAYRAEPTALAAYFARLSDRLRRVRFLCGDWRRACKDSVTVNHGLTALFLDPPYPAAEHDMGYHSEEAGDVWHAAAAWAVERGADPRLRIAIAGYHSDESDALFPKNWERVRWTARGGYANQKADGRGRTNAARECLWFSPACVDAATDYGPLFE